MHGLKEKKKGEPRIVRGVHKALRSRLIDYWKSIDLAFSRSPWSHAPSCLVGQHFSIYALIGLNPFMHVEKKKENTASANSTVYYYQVELFTIQNMYNVSTRWFTRKGSKMKSELVLFWVEDWWLMQKGIKRKKFKKLLRTYGMVSRVHNCQTTIHKLYMNRCAHVFSAIFHPRCLQSMEAAMINNCRCDFFRWSASIHI